MLKHLTQKNKNSKPNSESKCRKSRFKKQTHNLNQKKKIQNPTQNLNADKSRFKKFKLINLNQENQDSETNGSSNELTKPSEKHTKWYANRKLWNKRLFR
ncbi:hypothetical protein HYE14_02080 [Mycoplasmopsis bovis]|nr:hypothetical protein [Mycoplasmopsis bovis]QQH25805.1 hypothetical protein HYE14_02080 [Mycoplasmopsis bovis]